MSSENLTDQFASAVMTGAVNEADIARAGVNGACDAMRRESRNPAGKQSNHHRLVFHCEEDLTRNGLPNGCARAIRMTDDLMMIR